MGQITKTSDLKGYRLTRQDIDALCDCLAEEISSTSDQMYFLINFKDRKMRKDTFEEMAADDSIPALLNNLVIAWTSYSHSSGYRSVGVSFSKESASLEIVGNDEIWVEGKSQLIKNFLRNRASKGRWLLARYGGIILFSLLAVASLVLATFDKTHASLVVLGFSALVFVLCIILGLRLTAANIILVRDVGESWLKRNASTILIAVITASIGAAVTYIMTRALG